MKTLMKVHARKLYTTKSKRYFLRYFSTRFRDIEIMK